MCGLKWVPESPTAVRVKQCHFTEMVTCAPLCNDTGDMGHFQVVIAKILHHMAIHLSFLFRLSVIIALYHLIINWYLTERQKQQVTGVFCDSIQRVRNGIPLHALYGFDGGLVGSNRGGRRERYFCTVTAPPGLISQRDNGVHIHVLGTIRDLSLTGVRKVSVHCTIGL